MESDFNSRSRADPKVWRAWETGILRKNRERSFLSGESADAEKDKLMAEARTTCRNKRTSLYESESDLLYP